MPDHPELMMIETLVIVLSVGALIAYLFQRVQLPTVLGYILTGVLMGPQVFGLLQEEQVRPLAQIGIIFLLFIVGLELSVGRIRQLRFQAPLAGVLQLAFTTLMLTVLLRLVGLPLQLAYLLGSILALSSTAIVLKSLEDNAEIDTVHGRLILGILIIQDLSIVPLMTLLPTFMRPFSHEVLVELALVMLKALAFGGIAVWVSLKLVPRFLDKLASAHSKELFTLSMVLVGLGMALLTEKMGLSYEAGAFVAGLALSGSVFCRQVVSDSRTFRDVFMTLFFVSMGLLFRVDYLFQHPATVLLGTGALVIVKALAAFLAVRVLRFPAKAAIWSGLSLFQVGEFSFILLDRTLAQAAHVSDWAQLLAYWSPLLVNAIILSMFLTPLVLRNIPRLVLWRGWSLPEVAEDAEGEALSLETSELPEHTRLKNQVVIAGYGPTAQNLTAALSAQQVPYVIVEMNINTVKRLQKQGISCLYGDISHPEILKAAGVWDADILAVTFPDLRTAELAIERARQINPNIYCMVRSRYRGDVDRLYAVGANDVIYEELEISISFIFTIMRYLDFPLAQVDRLIGVIRDRERQNLRHDLHASEQPVFGRFNLLEGTKLEWVKLRPESELVGKSLAESGIRQRTGVNVVSVIDAHAQLHQEPQPDLVLQANDVLVVVGGIEQLHQLENLV